MIAVKDSYRVLFKGEIMGYLYVYDDGSTEYSAYGDPSEDPDMESAPEVLKKDASSKKAMPFFKKTMTKDNLVRGRRRTVYENGDVSVVRIAEDVIDRMYIYRCGAEKGDPDYSEKDHSAPHCEGSGPIEGMEEWATWYCFDKMDDGTYVAELDEAWYWGGSHNDGGTIREEIPEEWMDLPYDEFLDEVVALASAAHYGFTADVLKDRKGLREFFGFDRGCP